MPTYEYKCRTCGKEFEVVQRITEQALTECPEEGCKGEIYRKISKNIGLVFNGSGFYCTDYSHKKEAPPTLNGNGSAKHSGTKNGNGSTDAKKETPVPAAATTN